MVQSFGASPESQLVSRAYSPTVILPPQISRPPLLTTLLRGDVLDECIQSDIFSAGGIISSLRTSISLLHKARLFELELAIGQILQVFYLLILFFYLCYLGLVLCICYIDFPASAWAPG
jgi:hypothetical protein